MSLLSVSLLSVSLPPRVLELLLLEVLLLLLLEVLLPPLLLPAWDSPPSPTTSVRALMSSASFPDWLPLLLPVMGTQKYAATGIGSEV